MSRSIRRIADIAAFDLPQRRVREVLSERTATSDAVALRVVDLDPARADDPRVPHTHERMEEVLVVLEGSGYTWIEGAWYGVGTGDAWVVPAGAKHATVNPGPGTLRLLCFFPSGRPEDDYHEHPEVVLSGWEGAP